MDIAIKRIHGIAGICIGVAFAGQLSRFLWLERNLQPVEAQNFYALEDVISIIDSPMWSLTGVLHVIVAAALVALALPESKQGPGRDLRLQPRAMAAAIASGMFLLLGMTHLIGVPQIRTLSDFCAEDGRTVLAAYSLLRVVLLGSGLFALGWFLVFDAGSKLGSGIKPRLIPVIGLIAGVLCVLFAFFYTAAPQLLTTLMMAAVAVWGSGQALPQSGRLTQDTDIGG